MNFLSHRITFVEVIGAAIILLALLGIIIMTINPVEQLASSRDEKRLNDVYTLLSALHEYAEDHEGQYPPTITEEEKEICRETGEACSGLADVSVLITSGAYLEALPMDPQCPASDANCSEQGTGYFVNLSPEGRLVVNAYGAEEREIRITR